MNGSHIDAPPAFLWAHLPFNKLLKSVNYRETWCDVLCHLQRRLHKLEMRGRATSALSSASGSCQHILTSPGGGQLGLTSSGARGGPWLLQLPPLSFSFCQTHTKYINTHIKTQTFTYLEHHKCPSGFKLSVQWALRPQLFFSSIKVKVDIGFYWPTTSIYLFFCKEGIM